MVFENGCPRIAVVNRLNIMAQAFVFVVLWFRTTWLRLLLVLGRLGLRRLRF